MRAKIVKELRNNRHLYLRHVVWEELEGQLDPEADPEAADAHFVGYTAAMAQPGTFGGAPELQAAAHLYRARITVFAIARGTTGEWQYSTQHFQPQSAALVERELALVHHGIHYDLAVLRGGQQQQQPPGALPALFVFSTCRGSPVACCPALLLAAALQPRCSSAAPVGKPSP